MRRRCAFTLIELLVVIAIIAMLIGLIFPAVQSVRESARRAQCANNVAQFAKAAISHETTQGFFPSGGWGSSWVGDADRGFGRTQPGGFMYSLLPYMEQQAAWALPTDGNPNAMGTAQLNGGRTLALTLLPPMNCPTRRPAQLLPQPTGVFIANNATSNASTANNVARGDYAVNGGDDTTDLNPSGPPASVDLATFSRPMPTTVTGIAGPFSEVKASDILDGASLTYLIGERYVDSAKYFTGSANHDDGNWAQGTSNDTVRSGSASPAQDKADPDGVVSPGDNLAFGSAHSTSFCMLFADGAVKWIRYDIPPTVHKNLSNCRDGNVIPGNVIR